MRAVGRALAARRGRPGELSCRTVWVGKQRSVEFAESAGGDVTALAQDLRARGAPRLAEQLVASYALAADDYEVLETLDAPARGALLAIAVGGLVATGKSTAAKAIARRIDAMRVVADRVRLALLAEAGQKRAHELSWEPAFGDQVYAGLLERAGRVLASRRSVVIDACFPDQARRDEAAALAARHGARFVFVHCVAPEEDVIARLRLRDTRDDALPGAWQKLARELEARWEPPRPSTYVQVDTSLPRKSWLRVLGVAGPGLEEEAS